MPLKTERNIEIYAKSDAGWSSRRIAKHYNISHVRVLEILKEREVREKELRKAKKDA